MPFRVVALLASVAVVGAGAAPAGARIGSPSDVTPAGRVLAQVQPAAGGGRTAVLMTTIKAATRDVRDPALVVRLGAGTRLGAPKRLARGYADGQVAVGADGTAVAAWTIGSRKGTVLRVAVANPDKPFGRPQTLSHARRIALEAVVVTKTGRAVVVSTHRTGVHVLQAAIREPGRRFGSARKLGTSRYEVGAAAAPDGTVVVTWLTNTEGPPPPPAPYTPSPALVLMATLAPAASAFGPATQLAALDAWYSGPRAFGGPGGAAVAWRQTGAEQRVAFLQPDGALGPAESLPFSFPGAGEGRPDELALGIPASGPATALWQELRGTLGDVLTVTSSVVHASRRPVGGSFGPAARISRRGALVERPRAAATNDRIVSAWAEGHRDTAGRVCIEVHTPTKVSAEASCPRARLVDASTVDVAASGGYGIVTWIQGRGGLIGGGLARMAIWRR